jgi:hypothetical protein
MGFRRRELSMAGSMFGQAIDDGITLTASPTSVELVPIIPQQVSVRLADTAAGLAAAPKLLRAINAEWAVANRHARIFALNDDFASFAGTIEAKPNATASLTLAADAVGKALRQTMLTGTTKFMRIEAVGPVIEASIHYLLTIDLSLKVTGGGEQRVEDELVAIQWNFTWAHDQTWGKVAQFTLQNKLTGL